MDRFQKPGGGGGGGSLNRTHASFLNSLSGPKRGEEGKKRLVAEFGSEKLRFIRGEKGACARAHARGAHQTSGFAQCLWLSSERLGSAPPIGPESRSSDVRAVRTHLLLPWLQVKVNKNWKEKLVIFIRAFGSKQNQFGLLGLLVPDVSRLVDTPPPAPNTF